MATPDLLEALEIETAPFPTAAVVWLHGLGADGYDFVDIVPALRLSALPTRFVFPHAPTRPVTINGGMVMRAWYDVHGDAGVRREDEAGVRESQRQIEALIAREKTRGIPAGRIVLAGFSPGSVTSSGSPGSWRSPASCR
jgi:phospholipase/carboxylesterase